MKITYSWSSEDDEQLDVEEISSTSMESRKTMEMIFFQVIVIWMDVQTICRKQYIIQIMLMHSDQGKNLWRAV